MLNYLPVYQGSSYNLTLKKTLYLQKVLNGQGVKWWQWPVYFSQSSSRTSGTLWSATGPLSKSPNQRDPDPMSLNAVSPEEDFSQMALSGGLYHSDTNTYMHLAGVDAAALQRHQMSVVKHYMAVAGGEFSFPWGKTAEVWTLFFTSLIVWGDCGNHRATDSQIVCNAFSEVIGMLDGILFSELHTN